MPSRRLYLDRLDVQSQLVVDGVAVDPSGNRASSGRKPDPADVLTPILGVSVERVRAVAGARPEVDGVGLAGLGDDRVRLPFVSTFAALLFVSQVTIGAGSTTSTKYLAVVGRSRVVLTGYLLD